ncbi:hypothetical protein [Flavobacterium polysaccharolyticum]|uniref:Uncharacterized protein n=1 Tax=Flavobacterium polysaccharolyticum TaxID=3133148 RepID=A0ABU9NK07_9FLAO
MKPFATLLLLFFILFLFKPSIVSIIEKKTTISFTKEAIEEDDTNEEKKIASFEQPIEINIPKKTINTSSKRSSMEVFSFSNNPIQKINTPPPQKARLV